MIGSHFFLVSAQVLLCWDIVHMLCLIIIIIINIINIFIKGGHSIIEKTWVQS